MYVCTCLPTYQPTYIILGFLQILYGVVNSGDPRIQVNASSEQFSLNVVLLPDTEYYFAVGAVSQVSTEGAGLSQRSKIHTNQSGVCVCVRERGRGREGEGERERGREREKERERERERGREESTCVCVHMSHRHIFKLYVFAFTCVHVYFISCMLFFHSPVPSQPQNVNVQSVTPQTAEISWDLLTGARTGASVGVLKSYVVAYKEVGELWETAKQVTVPPSASSVLLDDLIYNTSYVVSVKGVNDLGEGQPGYSRLFRTLSLSELSVCLLLCLCVRSLHSIMCYCRHGDMC